MSERITYNAEIERRQEYTRRIVKAVNYKGNADHEDVPSILREFQEEIIKELTDKIVEQLEEASHWTEPHYDEDGYSCDDEYEVITLDIAIEIVKKGGAV